MDMRRNQSNIAILNKPAYDTAVSFCKNVYKFAEPCKLRIRKPSGEELLLGYGVHDSIEVLSPSWVFLIPGSGILGEVPLADGSVIIEYWDYFGNNQMKDATESYDESDKEKMKHWLVANCLNNFSRSVT